MSESRPSLFRKEAVAAARLQHLGQANSVSLLSVRSRSLAIAASGCMVVAALALVPYSRSISASGVALRAEGPIIIRAPAPGYVDVKVQSDQPVDKGALLAEVRRASVDSSTTDEYEVQLKSLNERLGLLDKQLAATLKSADQERASWTERRNRLDALRQQSERLIALRTAGVARVEKLVAQGFMSQAAAEQDYLNLEQSRLALHEVQSRLADIDAESHRAQDAIRDRINSISMSQSEALDAKSRARIGKYVDGPLRNSINSESAARVLTINVQNGAFVREGDQIAELQPIGPLRVLASIPGERVGAIRIGQAAMLRQREGGLRMFRGEIVRITTKRSETLEARFPISEHLAHFDVSIDISPADQREFELVFRPDEVLDVRFPVSPIPMGRKIVAALQAAVTH